MRKAARHLSGTRVIGMGNPLRGDDGIGPVVAARVRALHPGLEGVEVLHDPLGLLDLCDGAETVIVVDAIVSGAAPGTLHRFDASKAPLPARWCGSSTHAVGLAEVIELGRALGRLPAHLLVVGVEAGRCDTGQGLSSRLEAAIDAAVALLMREIGVGSGVTYEG